MYWTHLSDKHANCQIFQYFILILILLASLHNIKYAECYTQ